MWWTQKLRQSNYARAYAWKYDYKATQDLTDSTNTSKKCQESAPLCCYAEKYSIKVNNFASAYIMSYLLWLQEVMAKHILFQLL